MSDHKKNIVSKIAAILLLLVFTCSSTVPVMAQGKASVNARIDARKITVGDRVRLFIEVKADTTACRVEWAAIPDTFNSLEVVEKGKLDTLVQGKEATYKQRLLLTGFDSGLFQVPAFQFAVRPLSGSPYVIQTDSFPLWVQTVAVDTTKAFKPIKGIMEVKATWRDYIEYIAGGAGLILLLGLLIWYLMSRKKKQPPVPDGPKETPQEYALRLLSELEAKQLWQNQKVKDYYVELTDIVRDYIEARFDTAAMELTTDELLHKAQRHKELRAYYELLSVILRTADLAKFAKAQPLPEEHVDAMEKSRKLIIDSKPVIVPTSIEKEI